MNYLTYRWLSDYYVALCVKAAGVSKVERRDPTYRKTCLVECLQQLILAKAKGDTEASSTLNIVRKELEAERWLSGKRTTIFLENEDLVRALLTSSLAVDASALEWDRFPSTFVLAAPDMVIKGHRLSACYVCVYTPESSASLAARLRREIPMLEKCGYSMCAVPKPVLVLIASKVAGMDGSSVTSCTAVIPIDQLQKLMDASALAAVAKTSEDIKLLEQLPWLSSQLALLLRLLAATLVYMQACPDMVKEGLPAGLKEKDVAHKADHTCFMHLTMPSRKLGPHGSPATHWRRWHFRSYPTRLDGTKKKGAVFVSGGWVNATDEAETVTGPGKEFG